MAETNVHVFYQHDSDDYAIHVDDRERLHVDHLPHKGVVKYEALRLRDSIDAVHVYFTDKDENETEI